MKLRYGPFDSHRRSVSYLLADLQVMCSFVHTHLLIVRANVLGS